MDGPEAGAGRPVIDGAWRLPGGIGKAGGPSILLPLPVNLSRPNDRSR